MFYFRRNEVWLLHGLSRNTNKARKELLTKNMYENLFLRYGESFLDEELKKEKNDKILFTTIEKKFDYTTRHEIIKKMRETYACKNFDKSIDALVEIVA